MRRSRRHFVAGSLASGMIGLMPRTPAAADKVFLDYTQEELDNAYEQRIWAPNAEEIIRAYATDSAAVRARLVHRAGIAYGASAAEALDLFPTEAAKAPVLVFVHGGRWRGQTKEDASFLAPLFVAAGAHYIALGFANIPEVRLPEMAAQVRRGVAWTRRNASSFGGDPERIFVAGHSSGGHLAAVALTTDWPGAFGLPPDTVKGGICVSGMYDLEGPMRSARSAYVKITPEEEAALSPLRHLDRLAAPVVVAYGGRESPEFQRHARAFAAALAPSDRLAGLVFGKGLNHFELITTMAQSNSTLTAAALRLMNLG
jgi:arylformamidase